MGRYPFDDWDADRIPEPEERLIERNGDGVIVGAHQPRSLSRRHQPYMILALARFEHDLASVAAPWRAQTSRNVVGSQFGHRLP